MHSASAISVDSGYSGEIRVHKDLHQSCNLVIAARLKSH